MAEFGTIWRMGVAGLTVWRLARLIFQDEVCPGMQGGGVDGGRGTVRGGPESLLGGRFMDFFYWLHVWLSAQTAVWVACGFAGVFVSWVAASGVSRALAARAQGCESLVTAAGDSAGQGAAYGEVRGGFQEAAQ